MQRKGIVWVTALVAGLVAAAVAGATTTAGKGSKDVTLNLVAYSTPRPVLTKLIDEFRKTPQGAGITIRASYGPSSAQGQAVANGLPADGVDPQHGERHQRPRRQGADQQELGQAELQRRRLELGRGLWPPRRQPEEDQGLERPDQARRTGRDGEPVHRGDREVEHSRVLRRAAPARQDRRAGARLAAEVLQEQCRLAGLVRLECDEHVPLGQGRRPAHVRERGDQREAPVRDPAPDDVDRRLHRGDPDEPAQGRVDRVLAVPQDLSGAEDPRAERVPAGQQAGARRVQEQVPDPTGRDHDHEQAARRLARVDKKWFDPRKSLMQQIEQSLGVPT